MRQPSFRGSIQSRRDCLSRIVPLLNFNEVYYSNAIEVSDILGRPDFSGMKYEHAFARMDSMVGQAITELEHGLTPMPEPNPKVKFELTDEHGVWWFFWHSKSRTQLKFLAVLGSVFLVGLGLGSNQFFMRLYNLTRSSTAPSTNQVFTTTNNVNK